MPQPKVIDSKTLDKLRKIWALRLRTTFAGEGNAAEFKAAQILAPFGYGVRHVEELLATNGRPISPAWELAWKQRQEAASKYEAVIRRCGSKEAALVRQPREKQLRQAVEHLCTFDKNWPGWVSSIDGWHNRYPEKPSRRATELVSSAYPLPGSITEAQAEYDYWNSRNEDLRVIFSGLEAYETGDEQLDMPAVLRRDIVEELLATGLQAMSVGEVLIRQRYLSGLEHLDEIQQAVLRDLEHLAAVEIRASVQNGQNTGNYGSHINASQRRAAIEEMLSNVDTRSLADREIARRLGVSSQTVGNIRRRLFGAAAFNPHSSSSRGEKAR